MALSLALFLVLALSPLTLAEEIKPVTVIVDGSSVVAKTDEHFVCATLDWWPHDKCDYNMCPWDSASAMNLDLSHPLLSRAVQAFGNLRIRIGGSLQDRLHYKVGNLKSPCHPFSKMKGGLFGFSMGCLTMSRWDELNNFFSKTGSILTFGLNALHGRRQIKKSQWGGDWDHSNAQDFMNYTRAKGYMIDSWEFGNELSGNGVGANVAVEQYAKDVISLKKTINDVYQHSLLKPSLIAPGGFFNHNWFDKLLQLSGHNVINAMSHHIYNLGAGVDRNIVNKILDPKHLSKISETFGNMTEIIQKHGSTTSAWVGESGGAYNSGARNVSDTFVDSFWYLDQLGMASRHHTKVYCRQTLVGGNYGLLNTATFVPNPDYYSALLWHRLMGRRVLAVGSDAPPYLRAYAHCSKGKDGVTLLLINLSKQTNFIINVQNSMNMELHASEESTSNGGCTSSLKRTFSWVGSKATNEKLEREEYHFSPKDGYLQSKTMLLNGVPLEPTDDGNIPILDPVHLDVKSPITVSPLSIAFIVLPNFDAPACA